MVVGLSLVYIVLVYVTNLNTVYSLVESVLETLLILLTYLTSKGTLYFDWIRSLSRTC